MCMGIQKYTQHMEGVYQVYIRFIPSYFYTLYMPCTYLVYTNKGTKQYPPQRVVAIDNLVYAWCIMIILYVFHIECFVVVELHYSKYKFSFKRVYLTSNAPFPRFPPCLSQLSYASSRPLARVLVPFFIALLIGIGALHRRHHSTQGGLVVDFAVAVIVVASGAEAIIMIYLRLRHWGKNQILRLRS